MLENRIIHESDYRPFKKYVFHLIDKGYRILADREFLEYLKKWGLDQSLNILSYSYKDEYEDLSEEKLVLNLLQTQEVTQRLNFPDLSDSGEIQDASITIEMQAIPCSVLSMDFFDRICDQGLALEDGTIRKCFEDYMDDIVVADELKSMLLLENSDNYCLFSDEERDQFLFRIFQHLVLGGRRNQYEDNINPYLSSTKMLYKDLVCVRKTGAQKSVTIISEVFKLICKINGKPVIPSPRLHRQDFLYVIINPTLKNLTLFSHIW